MARDHTAQPKQRLANQGKTTTVLVHVFRGVLRLSVLSATQTHTVWYSSRGALLCLQQSKLKITMDLGLESDFDIQVQVQPQPQRV